MQVNACPGCGERAGELVGNEGPAFCYRIDDRLFYQPPYRIRRCRRCGLCYRTVTLAPDYMAEYYQRVDFQQWDGGALFPTEGVIYNFLKALPAPRKVFDFGCSIGRLLATLTDEHHCYGAELNLAAAAIAQQRGLTMLTTAAWQAEEFDVIILHDVFEHLYAPTAMLAQLAARVAPGAI